MDYDSQGHYKLLNARGDAHSQNFQAYRTKNDIDKSIENYERALDIAMRMNFFDPVLQASLAGCRLKRFEVFGDIQDADQAISIYRDTLKRLPNDTSYLSGFFSNLGMALLRRFEATGDMDDIEEAIHVQKRALELTSESHDTFTGILNNLSVSYFTRYQHSNDVKDMDNSISMLRKVIQYTPAGHEDMPMWIHNLGNSLDARFERRRNPEDIEEAVDAHRQAVLLTPHGHPDLPSWMSGLSLSLRVRYKITNKLEDLNEAVSIQRVVVELTPEDHASFSSHVTSLSNALMETFEVTRNHETCDDAILTLRKALETNKDKEGTLSAINNSLGNAYLYRFEYTGNLDDMREAIDCHQKAITQVNNNSELAAALNNLGSSCHRRFERTGDLKDIEEAISARQHAIRVTPPDHIYIPIWLSNLGYSFRCRFERTRDIDDIMEAISLQEEALELSVDGTAVFGSRLNNLSLSYQSLFGYNSKPDVLLEAIAIQKRSIKLPVQDESDLPGKWSNLGNMLLSYFEETDKPEIIQESVSAHETALELTPPSHPAYSVRLNNLGNSLQRRFERYKDVSDVETAISVRHKAINAGHDDHTQLSMWLNNLGYSYLSISRHSPTEESLSGALAAFKSSAELTIGPAMDRMTGAMEWAGLSYLFDFLKEMCLEAYGVAFDLLPKIAWVGFDIDGRQRQLRKLSNLSHTAAAAAISLGRYEKALEWLEQGRGVIWNQLNNLRTPVDALWEVDEHIANELLRVSWQLENSGNLKSNGDKITSLEDKIVAQEQTMRQQELAHEWDLLLDQARKVPGFDDLLRPMKLDDFATGLTRPGYTVVINMDDNRCDALALKHGEKSIIHIPLPDISYAHTQRLSKLLNRQLLLSGVRMREARSGRPLHSHTYEMSLGDILSELWERIMKPIVDALHLHALQSKATHIWWCPVGPLAFLPIHAAGNYGKRNMGFGSVLSDYVISSYTPTVTLMVNKIKNRHEFKGKFSGVLVVGQPNAPDLPSIPGAKTECEGLQQFVESKGYDSLYLDEHSANIASVSQAMDNYSWIHLACHASQEDGDPTRSSFYLGDGKLDLSTISKKRLPHADFAFLSACQTSTGDEALAEEAVHLAAGMFTAGYRNVIATMWSIQDEYAPKIAHEVYSYLLGNNGPRNEHAYPDSCRAAEALHRATRKIREELGDDELSYLVWVPYVHIGL